MFLLALRPALFHRLRQTPSARRRDFASMRTRPFHLTDTQRAAALRCEPPHERSVNSASRPFPFTLLPMRLRFAAALCGGVRCASTPRQPTFGAASLWHVLPPAPLGACWFA